MSSGKGIKTVARELDASDGSLRNRKNAFLADAIRRPRAQNEYLRRQREILKEAEAVPAGEQAWQQYRSQHWQAVAREIRLSPLINLILRAPAGSGSLAGWCSSSSRSQAVLRRTDRHGKRDS